MKNKNNQCNAVEAVRLHIWQMLDDLNVSIAFGCQVPNLIKLFDQPTARVEFIRDTDQEAQLREARKCLLELVSDANEMSCARLPTLIRRSRKVTPFLAHVHPMVRACARRLDRAIMKEAASRMSRVAA